MRGQDEQQLGAFSYISLEQPIPHNQPEGKLFPSTAPLFRSLLEGKSRLSGTLAYRDNT